MARLNTTVFDSDDDDLPELCTLLRRLGQHEDVSLSKAATKNDGSNVVSADENQVATPRIRKKYFEIDSGNTEATEPSSHNRNSARKQRPLRLAHVNSLLLPISRNEVLREENRDDGLENAARASSPTPTRRKAPSSRIEQPSTPYSSGDDTSRVEEGSSFDDMSDFIVDDSASDCEEIPAWIPKASKLKSRKDERADAGENRSVPEGNRVDWKSPTKSISRLPRDRPLFERTPRQPVGVVASTFNDEPEAHLKLYESFTINF